MQRDVSPTPGFMPSVLDDPFQGLKEHSLHLGNLLSGSFQIFIVNLKANALFCAILSCRQCRVPDAQEGVQHHRLLPLSVKSQASARQFNRKGRRVWTLTVPVLNCFVGNEPGIAPAPHIIALGVFPAIDVALV